MTRISTAVAILMLLGGLSLPNVASAEVKTVYLPGAHPRVVVLPVSTVPTRVANPAQAALTPVQVIARHSAMASAQRGTPRGNASAADHCARLIAAAEQQIRQNQ